MAGSDNRIYHYNYFNYSKNVFGNLSIFEFDPDTFNLHEWTFASSGTWNRNGWLLQNVAVHRHVCRLASESDGRIAARNGR